MEKSGPPQIEAPSPSQRFNAAIETGAQWLSLGQDPSIVAKKLSQLGVGIHELQEIWPDIHARRNKITHSRLMRHRISGICWLATGTAMITGLAWSVIIHQTFAWILLIGLIPLTYGLYLLVLPAHSEPTVNPPNFFGRDPH